MSTSNNVALVISNDKDFIISSVNLLKIVDTDSLLTSSIEESKLLIGISKSISIIVVDSRIETNDMLWEEFYLFVKKRLPNTPIIVISSDSSFKIPSLVFGATAVFNRPFSEVEFLMTVKNLISLVQAYDKLEDADHIIDALMSSVEARDFYTKGHSKRVATLSVKLLEALGDFSAISKRVLYTGALLHDIGKIGVSDDILKSSNKIGPADGINIIRKHPEMGYQICKSIERLEPSLEIILSHHEKLDGSGYPNGKTNLSLNVQIVTICDMFDAMTSNRSYRDALPLRKCIDILNREAEEGKINKELLEIFKEKILQFS